MLSMKEVANMFGENSGSEHSSLEKMEMDVPNEITVFAIEEGRKLMKDSSSRKYSDIKALKDALEI